ncbi:MAG TPA: flagellar type III secretion system pore protein FliP [Pirellulales bacterium]|nr:flagellar type III secretion system pore protein FliP [Pirellulales bacterium]
MFDRRKTPPRKSRQPAEVTSAPKRRKTAAKLRCWTVVALVALSTAASSRPLAAQQQQANSGAKIELPAGLAGGPEQWTSPEGLSSTLQIMLLLTVISLAPSVLLMTTCFVRILVVFGLLRQALGTQQLPPSQVLTSISLFLTLMVMMPVWKQVYDNSVLPYTQRRIGLEQAWKQGIQPVRRFMSQQIQRTGNEGDIRMFFQYMPAGTPEWTDYNDVPLQALLPAYMLSELKTAFLIGFQIYLPFLILDIVVASITISMGMMMLPPVLISLPFKLLLFVLVDGWHLVVDMLLKSFQPFT